MQYVAQSALAHPVAIYIDLAWARINMAGID